MRSALIVIALILSTITFGADWLVDPVRLVGLPTTERMMLMREMYGTRMYGLDEATFQRYERALRETARAHHDADLMREAALWRAHYYFVFGSKFAPERVIGVFDSLAAQAEREHSVWLRLRAESLLAHFKFSGLQRYEQGFAHYTRLGEMLEGVSTAEFPVKPDMLHDIAMAYYKFRDYATAAVYFARLSEAEDAPGISVRTPSALSDIGLCHRELGDLDSADHYFRRAHELALAQGNEAWAGITTGNLGHNEYLRGHYDAARSMLEVDLANARRMDDHGLAAGALITLGDMDLRQNDLRNARLHLEEAERLVRSSGQYERFARLYPLLAKLSASTGDQQRAGAYIDSAMFVRDSLDRAFNVLKFTRIEQKLAAERQQARETELRLLGEERITRRNGIIIALSLGMFIALIVFNRYRHATRLKQAAAAERERHAEAELLSATERLEDFRRSFQEKSALLEEAVEEVTRLRESTPASVPDNPDREFHLTLLQKSVLLTDQDWAEFSALFERVHTGFFSRLAEKMPGLTPAETRFMALSRMGMNGREMAAMLGVGTDAIRQVRHRVRRKADMGEDATMEQVAAAI